jgi:hypothetical protein
MLIDEGDAIEHESESVFGWRAAMKLMDKYPWHRMHFVAVHPEFRTKIAKARNYRRAVGNANRQ